jgi:tetratricopeptide (TPR) repeat protein
MCPDPDLEQMLDDALGHQQSGHLDLAAAAYETILDLNPNETEALNLLGLIRHQQGDSATAIALLQRALEIDPDFPEALTNLALSYRGVGRAADAVSAATRAVELAPTLGEAYLQRGLAQLDLQIDEGAIASLRAAASLLPQTLEILVPLGTALIRIGDFAGAESIFRALVTLNPDHVESLANLGSVLLHLERIDEALVYHQRAATLAPNDVAALALLLETLGRRQDAAACVALSRRLIALAPARAEFWVVLGANLSQLGDFDGAEQSLRQALALDPDSVRARHGLTAIRQQEAAPDDTALLSARLHDETAPIRERFAAGFALGALLDQTGAYAEAFAAYSAANRLFRDHSLTEGRGFDIAVVRQFVDAKISAFQPQTFARLRDWGDPSELPVFIVGMPRSGTTLVEQILASHPQVFGAGELKDISHVAKRIAAQQGGSDRREVKRGMIRQEAAAHIEKLRTIGGGARRVTDKMPDNILNLAEIAMLFPRARIILCQRDLRDVCLSCYFSYFTDGIEWSFDLADCAARAREVQRLAKHWTNALPLPIMEVRYERLVSDLEGESRRLIHFLGLEWDPACLRYYETERLVQTVSAWQVRQPVYGSSVGRWRRYREYLGPLLEGLKGLVPEEQDESIDLPIAF